MRPMLNTAVKAARRAGSIINRASLNLDRLQVSRKGPKNYVTEVDHAAEQAIIDTLSEAYPSHQIWGEETGVHQPSQPTRGDVEYEWIIDPLDGTTNFINGLPIYAVSIALRYRGVLSLAVIFDPSRNELFTATRGDGAFLNDRRIRVSRQERYHDALIGTALAGSVSDFVRSKPFSNLVGECASARRLGAAVLDLANVAAGRFDGFCGTNLKPWDLAAGGLLVLEAGGLIADFDGEQGWLESGSVVAATPKLFPQMLAYLQG